MADAAVDLTTLAAAKAYLAAAGVALPADEPLGALITAVSAQLQAYLGRRLPSQAYSERLNGEGGVAVFLPNTPITAVAVLKVSGVDVPAAQNGRDAGYIIHKDAVYLRGYWAERGIQNIEIEYTGGYVTIPADIVRIAHEAILQGISAWRVGQPGAVRLKAGDTEIDFGAVSIIAEQCITPAITGMLNPHRRVVPC